MCMQTKDTVIGNPEKYATQCISKDAEIAFKASPVFVLFCLMLLSRVAVKGRSYYMIGLSFFI